MVTEFSHFDKNNNTFVRYIYIVPVWRQTNIQEKCGERRTGRREELCFDTGGAYQ